MSITITKILDPFNPIVNEKEIFSFEEGSIVSDYLPDIELYKEQTLVVAKNGEVLSEPYNQSVQDEDKISISVKIGTGVEITGAMILEAIITTVIATAVAYGLRAIISVLGLGPEPSETEQEEQDPSTYSWGPLRQLETQGNPIPILFGTHRVAGQTINQFSKQDSEKGITFKRPISEDYTVNDYLSEIGTSYNFDAPGDKYPHYEVEINGEKINRENWETKKISPGDTISVYKVTTRSYPRATTEFEEREKIESYSDFVAVSGEGDTGDRTVTYDRVSNYESSETNEYLYMLLGVHDGLVDEIADIHINEQSSNDYKEVETFGRKGKDNDEPIEGFDHVVTQQNVNVNLNVGDKEEDVDGISEHTVTTSGYSVDEIRIELVAQRGLYYSNDDGSLSERFVKFSIHFRPVGDSNWIDYGDVRIRGGTTSKVSKRIDIKKIQPAMQYEVLIKRISDSSYESYREQKDVEWTSMREVVYEELIYPGLAKYAIRALATDQLSGGVPRVSALVKRNSVQVYTPEETEETQEYHKSGPGLIDSSMSLDRLNFETFAESNDYTTTDDCTAITVEVGVKTVLKAPDIGEVSGLPDTGLPVKWKIYLNVDGTDHELVSKEHSIEDSNVSKVEYKTWKYNKSVTGLDSKKHNIYVWMQYYTESTILKDEYIEGYWYNYVEGTDDSSDAWKWRNARNPAWACYALLNTHHNIHQDRLMYDEFKEWADYCDEEIDDNGTPRFRASIYLDQQENVWKQVQKIAELGRGTIVRRGTKYGVFVDKPDTSASYTTPVSHLFTMGNIIDETFNIQYLPQEDRANAVEITYTDPDKDYTRQVLGIYSPEYKSTDTISNKVSINYRAALSREQVNRQAAYKLNCNKYLIRTVEFDADVDSFACVIGDLVYFQHAVPHYDESFGGRIIDAGNDRYYDGTNHPYIQLDQEISLTGGETYAVLVRLEDDSLVEKFMEPDEDMTSDIFVLGSDWTTIPQKYDLYNFGKADTYKKKYRITSITRSQELTRHITLMEYRDEVYHNDEYIIPDDPDPDPIDPPDIKQQAINVTASERLVMGKGGDYQSNVVVSWDSATDSVETNWIVWIEDVTSERSFDDSFEVGTFQDTSDPKNPQKVTETTKNNVTIGSDYLTVEHAYRIYVTPLDASSAKDTGSNTITIQILGKLGPPNDVITFSGKWNSMKRTVEFTWNKVDNIDLSHYEIRQGTDWDTAAVVREEAVEGSAVVEIPNGVSETRTYLIKSVDTSGNYSVNSASTTVEIDTEETPLQIPTGLTLSTNSDIASDGTNKVGILATWDNNAAADPDFYRYELLLEDISSGHKSTVTTKETQYQFEVRPVREYGVAVKAGDKSGNDTPYCEQVTIVSAGDTNPPADVTGFDSSFNIQEREIFLSWNKVDDLDLSHYEIRQGTDWDTATVVKNEAKGFNTEITVEDGVNETRTYLIKAVDTSGNYSENAASLSADINSLETPLYPPINLNLTSSSDIATDGTNKVGLRATWDDQEAMDHKSFGNFNLEIRELDSGGNVENLSEYNPKNVEYTIEVKPKTSYEVRVRAQDRSGNVTSFTSWKSITSAGDTNPPTAPYDIDASGFFSSILLEWSHGAESDLSHFDIYRSTSNDSSTATKIGSTARDRIGTNAAFMTEPDKLDLQDQSYYFWIKAIDTSGNESNFSKSVYVSKKLIGKDNLSENCITAEKIVAGNVAAGHIDLTKEIPSGNEKGGRLSALSSDIGTIISGAIYSTTWDTDSDGNPLDSSDSGVEIDLNDGTIKFGGSSTPKLEYNGTDLTVRGTIEASVLQSNNWTDGGTEGIKIDLNNDLISVGGDGDNASLYYDSDVGLSVEGTSIKDGTINANQIDSDVINADHIDVSTLDAISANLGTITSGAIYSDNWDTDSDGSPSSTSTDGVEIDLNNKVINFGGSEDPNLHWSGTGLNIKGNITVEDGSGVLSFDDAGGLAGKDSADYDTDVSGEKPPSDADNTQDKLDLGADISDAEANGVTLISGGYLNTDILEIDDKAVIDTAVIKTANIANFATTDHDWARTGAATTISGDSSEHTIEEVTVPIVNGNRVIVFGSATVNATDESTENYVSARIYAVQNDKYMQETAITVQSLANQIIIFASFEGLSTIDENFELRVQCEDGDMKFMNRYISVSEYIK